MWQTWWYPSDNHRMLVKKNVCSLTLCRVVEVDILSHTGQDTGQWHTRSYWTLEKCVYPDQLAISLRLLWFVGDWFGLWLLVKLSKEQQKPERNIAHLQGKNCIFWKVLVSVLLLWRQTFSTSSLHCICISFISTQWLVSDRLQTTAAFWLISLSDCQPTTC